MIYNVRGTLTYTDINYAVVECGGVGFKCFVSMTTLKELPPLGKEANLYTYLSSRGRYGFVRLCHTAGT